MSARKARAAALVKMAHRRSYLRTRRHSPYPRLQPWQLELLAAARACPFPRRLMVTSGRPGLTWLRALITPEARQPHVRIGIDFAEGPDRNVVFLSGERQPLKLDDNERRFWIITDEVQP